MRLPISLAALVCVSGCTTTVEVTRLNEGNNGTARGVRFSLPQRFVAVEPKPDGTVDVKYVHLPDDANRFAVRSTSVLAKNTLSVTVASGLLTGLTFKPNAADVPAQFVTSAGNVRADEVATAVTSATTKETERKALDKEIRSAELALAQAQKKLELAVAALGDDESKILAYRIEVATAEAKLADLKQQKQLLGLAANEPPGIAFANNETKPRRAYGPMLFHIHEDYTDPSHPKVSLEPVEPEQRHYRVLASAAVRPGPTKPEPTKPSNGAASTQQSCPVFEDVVKGPTLSSNETRLVTLVFAEGLQFETATARSVDRPSEGLLTIDGKAGPTTPPDGVPALPDDDFDVVVRLTRNGIACEVKGLVKIPAP
jgi:hypothetical protein